MKTIEQVIEEIKKLQLQIKTLEENGLKTHALTEKLEQMEQKLNKDFGEW